MGKINREDMLELTRRMTLKRNCFSRIAGAYIDKEGFVDGTFNCHFLNLSPAEQQRNLAIAKAVPFSDTNVQLKEYSWKKDGGRPGDMRKLLMALRDCGLKNDAMLDVFYEVAGENYKSDKAYAVYFFYGDYDVPLKAADKENLWESEEVYKFLICAICPVNGDYEPGEPECGFMYPAFKDRSSAPCFIDVFQKDAQHPHTELMGDILFV